MKNQSSRQVLHVVRWHDVSALKNDDCVEDSLWNGLVDVELENASL